MSKNVNNGEIMDAKIIMNRITGDVQNFYKLRHKATGRWIQGRPPRGLTNKSQEAALFETPTAPRRSWSQRYLGKGDELSEISFDELEVVRFELIELGVV